MNWRKRVQEIAKRNPKGLHPLLARRAGEVFDSATYHSVQDETAPERPILFIFRWLASKGAVASHGFQALRDFEGDPKRADLRPEYFTPKGEAFLRANYQSWYATDGINYAIDPNLPFSETHLSSLWKECNGKKAEPGATDNPDDAQRLREDH